MERREEIVKRNGKYWFVIRTKDKAREVLGLRLATIHDLVIHGVVKNRYNSTENKLEYLHSVNGEEVWLDTIPTLEDVVKG